MNFFHWIMVGGLLTINGFILWFVYEIFKWTLTINGGTHAIYKRRKPKTVSA